MWFFVCSEIEVVPKILLKWDCVIILKHLGIPRSNFQDPGGSGSQLQFGKPDLENFFCCWNAEMDWCLPNEPKNHLASQVIMFQPYGPDLAPRNFWRFPTLKRCLHSRHFKSDAEVVRTIGQVFQSLFPDAFAKTIMDKLAERMNACLEAHRHYSEKESTPHSSVKRFWIRINNFHFYTFLTGVRITVCIPPPQEINVIDLHLHSSNTSGKTAHICVCRVSLECIAHPDEVSSHFSLDNLWT